MPVPATIDHHATGYSLAHAYCPARLADLAHKAEPVIEEMAGQWGFDRVRHHRTRFTPPFPLQDTQAFTMASNRMIVIAFRWSEPAQIRNWLSDATTPRDRGRRRSATSTTA
ncbi:MULTISPECIES: hypothetical protein [unclassified Streptomyces]|uniref:hypothetical protein n=1 Tax=unclassified Streptomyces TaxID=2593676 RepID=UPI003321E948